MDRRKAVMLAGAAIVGSYTGIFTLTGAINPEQRLRKKYSKQEYKNNAYGWPYTTLDPADTAERAYMASGGCMQASFNGILSLLADKFGEPYHSFPVHMMKYGHGGVGGFGSICGALNGASAMIGLLIEDGIIQDAMIAQLFRWYETTELPEFIPQKAILDFNPPQSVSNSVLCHISVTNWIKISGYESDSIERLERCRRLIGDVVFYTTKMLNEYFGNTYKIDDHRNETVGKCMQCHGNDGKLSNTVGKMHCNSCHDKSTHK
jgi:hypothetical protein